MNGKRTLATGLTMGLLFTLLASLGLAQEAAPQSPAFTGFTYQGRLMDDGSPANGEYEAVFSLYDISIGGTALASINEDLTISDGLFTLRLQFGSQYFTGDARWLEIALRPTGSADPYTTLVPRQELTPAPHALALPGLWTQTNTTSPNVIGGYKDNSVTAGVYGATIGGGGGSSSPSSVTDNYGTVGGGLGNQAGDGTGTVSDARYATVGGGWYNTASGLGATVAGGYYNVAGPGSATVAGGLNNIADYEGSTIGGGGQNHSGGAGSTVGGGNQNDASGSGSTIGGGDLNSIPAWLAFDSTIGGGLGNTISAAYGTIAGGGRSDPNDDGTGNQVIDNYGTVGGGGDNQAGGGTASVTDAMYATVGGGLSNEAQGSYATVPGGYDNVALGDYSLAAGQRAEAIHDGSFVWNDSTDDYLQSETEDQWLVRASGGYWFYTSPGLSSGVYVGTGGGAWSSLSDRDLKENIEGVDPQAVLAQVAAMPVSTWNYTTEDAAVRHMGPMAQDFYAAFGLGDSERHINSLDADGVSLAAIQGLYAENQELQARVEALEARLNALEKAGGGSATSKPQGWWLLGGLMVVGGVCVQRRGGGRR